MKNQDKLTRKEFLISAGVVGTTLIFGSTIFNACKKEESKPQQTKTEGPKCDDVTGLKPEDIEQRKNLQYVDNSPEPSKLCSNCALYIPAEAGAPCGGCNLIKGPISPNGWCTSWVPKA